MNEISVPMATDSDPGGLDVLAAFSGFAEPLREHIRAVSGHLGAGYPFEDADAVAEAQMLILSEGHAIQAVTQIEGLSYALAVIVEEAGERADAYERFLRETWSPLWGHVRA